MSNFTTSVSRIGHWSDIWVAIATDKPTGEIAVSSHRKPQKAHDQAEAKLRIWLACLREAGGEKLAALRVMSTKPKVD